VLLKHYLGLEKYVNLVSFSALLDTYTHIKEKVMDFKLPNKSCLFSLQAQRKEVLPRSPKINNHFTRALEGLRTANIENFKTPLINTYRQ
jgi:hypothetical protein